MKCFKLISHTGCTFGYTKWGENVTHTASGTDPNLCSDGFIHFYMDPRIAVVMNPTHAGFVNPILWEAEYSGKVVHEPLKSGSKTLTTIRQIPLPEISPTQKIAFGIYCAKEVCFDEKWNLWADRWLSGEDRTQKSASAAATYAFAASAAASADAVYYYAVYASKKTVNIDFIQLLDKAMLIK